MNSEHKNAGGAVPAICALLIFSMAVLAACGQKMKILIDGSSTVYPISEAMAEDYKKSTPDIHVTVGISGTGGGFKKFCHGETDISAASRPIKAEEIKACGEKAIKYVEIPVAYDGLAVVINPKNDFAKQLTVVELKKLFDAESPAKVWKDINPAWPAEKIKLYAPGKDSGTYDYFVEEILGKGKKVRADASFSEDDNTLVTGINGDRYAVGFFGLAYYSENKDKLGLVAVVNPKTQKAVLPSDETVKSGAYAPLSRPLFIYVAEKALARPDITAFVDFYLKTAPTMVSNVGYIALSPKEVEMAGKRWQSRKLGTMYAASHAGKTLEQILSGAE